MKFGHDEFVLVHLLAEDECEGVEIGGAQLHGPCGSVVEKVCEEGDHLVEQLVRSVVTVFTVT